jgi:Na+/H+ antiporter NhaA
MSVFLAQLAFEDGALRAAAKLGVLVSSALALIVSLLLGRVALPIGEPGRATR